MLKESSLKNSRLLVAFLLFFTITLHSNSVFAQKDNQTTEALNNNVYIRGKVVSSDTQKAIPFCSIQVENSFIGTSSNELGEFEIKVTQFPTKLIFSHLSYTEQRLTISEETSTLVVKMEPANNVLEEVVVKFPKDKVDQYAIDLAKKAYNNVLLSTKKINKYGKAFYRQKSKNSKEYSEFSEIIYDVRYDASGVLDWSILEGRYALKEEYINNKNFSRLSYTLKSIQPNTDDAIFPLREDLELYYNVNVKDVYENGPQNITVLAFTPKASSSNKPIFSGEVYVNTKTNDVLKVKGSLFDDSLKIILLKDKEATKKDYTLSYEMAFKKGSDGILLDYINISQEFDYVKNDKIETHISSSSNLTFFEYYQPTSLKKLGGKSRRGKSDWEKLNTIGYNKRFWENNAIVKRTPIESDVIRAFETNNSFETIFLNSREQIMAIQSKIGQDPFIRTLDKITNKYNNYNPVEKVFIHTDRDRLRPGDNLWYSAYTVLGEFHYYSNASKVVYIDLVNQKNEIVVSQKKYLFDGKSNGDLTIPPDLPEGNYELRGYTDWMKNYPEEFIFKKRIQIKTNSELDISNPVSKKIDLQFFPEGGHMIENLAGRVALKAIGYNGLGINLKGKIYDSKGNYVTLFQSREKGMGVFNFKPKSGESYTAILEDNSRHQLPKAISSGYSMLVNNINSKNIKVKIQASPDLAGKNFYLIGHVLNQKYYQARFNFGGKSYVSVEIPKNRIPSGVLTLTLFDDNMKPWCERIVFINNQEELVIQTSVDKSALDKGGDVQVNVLITDTEGKPVSTNFSLAITNKNRVVKNDYQSNILTHLLLESDLKGHVEDPAFYFKNRKRSTRYKLDLVMLTNGWRRFQWGRMKNYDIDSVKNHPFAKGFELSGVAKTMQNKPLFSSKLNMIAKSKAGLKMFSTTTDNLGHFTFKNLTFSDSTKIVLNAYDRKREPIDVKITLDRRVNAIQMLPQPFILEEKKNSKVILGETTELEAEYKKMVLEAKINTASILKKGIVLDEVIVKNNKRKISGRKSRFGIEPDAVLDLDSNQYFVDQLFKLPGVTVVGNRMTPLNPPRVSIRGSAPLWVVDGIPYASGGTGAGGASPSMAREGIIPGVVLDLSTRDIERVEVLKDIAATSQYGSRGNGGVIVIYTKGGSYNKQDIISPDFTILGMISEKEFYVPKYEIQANLKENKNTISTLYWNPSLVTNKQGFSSIKFQNQGNLKEIQIAIEALSENGLPGSYLQSFTKK